MNNSKSNQKNITLAIDLQEGFVDDAVIVRVNSKEVFSGEHITTNKLLGVSASIKTEVMQGMANVEIRILNRKIVKTISLDVLAPTYLGISLLKGMVDHVISTEPFVYA